LARRDIERDSRGIVLRVPAHRQGLVSADAPAYPGPRRGSRPCATWECGFRRCRFARSRAYPVPCAGPSSSYPDAPAATGKTGMRAVGRRRGRGVSLRPPRTRTPLRGTGERRPRTHARRTAAPAPFYLGQGSIHPQDRSIRSVRCHGLHDVGDRNHLARDVNSRPELGISNYVPGRNYSRTHPRQSQSIGSA
jgi:hypothetical protein